MLSKQKQWEEMWKKYDEMEEGVREAVVALNLLGINTTASCEGHLDRGVAAPWIDVAVEANEDLENKNKKADDLLEAAEHLLKEMPDHPEAHRLLIEYEILKDEILRENLQETVAVEKYLDKFYEKRAVEHRVKIVINTYGRGVGRLISQGGLYQEAFDKKKQAQYLEDYRREMKSLGEWLKENWFES